MHRERNKVQTYTKTNQKDAIMWTYWRKDWRHKKYNIRTLQDQIASPTLANIVLDKLDKFIAKYKESFESGKKR